MIPTWEVNFKYNHPLQSYWIKKSDYSHNQEIQILIQAQKVRPTISVSVQYEWHQMKPRFQLAVDFFSISRAPLPPLSSVSFPDLRESFCVFQRVPVQLIQINGRVQCYCKCLHYTVKWGFESLPHNPDFLRP